jgi:hypothetical protein
MALVSYSDSEGSDHENETRYPNPISEEERSTAASDTSKPSKSSPTFQPLVDRGNPRKIRVPLPAVKPENGIDTQNGDGDNGEPARKRPRTNGSGVFSGFNSLLPSPKRSGQKAAANNDKPAAPPRKVFSLKTSDAPGFDREADAEMRRDQVLKAGSTLLGSGSLEPESLPIVPAQSEPPKELKKKGNAMMFNPLSVARNISKTVPAVTPRPAANGPTKTSAQAQSKESSLSTEERGPTHAPTLSAAPEPKISLFSLSGPEKATPDALLQAPEAYEALLYNADSGEGSYMGDQANISRSEVESDSLPRPEGAGISSAPQTLDHIADDLNLSSSERRQLFGRNAQSLSSNSRILIFNTDAEYAANKELLNRTSEAEATASQHNPVRAIAPGKHTLRQLVNAATSQREALEESFASGRRNKKEAGSKYGW